MHSFEYTHLNHVHCEYKFCTNLLSKARNISFDVFLEFIFLHSFVVSHLLTNIWDVSYSNLL